MTDSRRRFFRRLQFALALGAVLLVVAGLMVLVGNVAQLNETLGPVAAGHQAILTHLNTLEREILLSQVSVNALMRNPGFQVGPLTTHYAAARIAFNDLQEMAATPDTAGLYAPESLSLLAALEPQFAAVDASLAELNAAPSADARTVALRRLDLQFGEMEASASELLFRQSAAEHASGRRAQQIVVNSQFSITLAGVLVTVLAGLLFVITRWSLILARRDNERFQLAAAAVEGAVYDYDVEHNGLIWTGSLTRVFGYPVDQVRNTLDWWLEHVHPDDRERTRRELDEKIGLAQDFSSEYRFRAYNGEYRHVWDRGQVLLTHGRVTRMVGVVVDITERKHAEEAARRLEARQQSEARFRSLVQNSSDAISILAANGTVLYNSESIEKVLGYTPEALIGKNALRRMHPHDLPLVRARILRVLEAPGEAVTLNFRFRHADGRWVHLEAVCSNGFADPSIRGVLVNSRDVSERVRSQELLQRQNAYLGALQDTALGLVTRLDLNSLFADILQRAGRLMGTADAFLFLVEEDHQAMVMQVASGVHLKSMGYRVRPGEGMAGRVWESGEPMVINDYAVWPDRLQNVDYVGDLHAMIGIPLKSGRQVVGLIGLTYTEAGRRFGPPEVDILTRFAQLASIALDNARLYDVVQQELRVRKEAEQRLLKAEANYRALVEQLPAIIYRVDLSPQPTVTYVSPQVTALLGYTPAEMITTQTRWLRLVHPDDRAWVTASAREHFAHGRPLDIEYRARTRDGRLLWMRNQSTVLRDESGQLQSAHGVLFDITAQKLSEAALATSESRNRALLDAIPDLMFLFSRDGVFLDSKRSSGNLLLPPEQFLGKNVVDVLPPPLASQTLQSIQETLRTGRSQIFEYQLPGNEGLRDFEARYVVSGRDEVLAIVRDITERKRALQELARARDAADAANRAKSVFLANMSHELRTPLNAIIGYSEMVADEMEDTGQRAYLDDLQKITGAGKHLLALINDILDLSKVEAGKMQLYLETFDIADMIRETVETIEPLAERNNNALKLNYDHSLGSMTADETRVRQSLYNLLSNACKFTENGIVWLNASTETLAGREWVVFRVADTGIGMSSEQVVGLFQDFSQADASTTRRYGGTGLGLAITRRFCEMMGGEIMAQSEVGRGSVFTIRLPRDVRQRAWKAGGAQRLPAQA